MNKKWNFATHGIPDDMFLRGDVPMTKMEIRTITLSKAKIAQDSVVWDIGAGTGSITIEAGILASLGQIYAVEKNPTAVGLLHRNITEFCLKNVKVVEGEAPSVLNSLPAPDVVMIGGSGGRLSEILQLTHRLLKPGGRVVVNAVTIETVSQALTLLGQCGFEQVEACQVAITRVAPVGKVNMLKAANPVFVISATKEK